MRTLCEKCIFADYASSDEPCKIGIVSEIQKYHKIEVSDTNFNIIPDYICRYGFSLEIYDTNKENIGSISDLRKIAEEKAKIKYYSIIEITDIDNIKNVCESISSLDIKPGYVSFLLERANNTDKIIQTIKDSIDPSIQWKIHNFLEDSDLNHKLSTITDTNSKNNETVYFWLDKDTNSHLWNSEIKKINDIIYIQQPRCHAMFRSENKDGLLLSFDLYKLMKSELGHNIFKSLDSIPSPQFVYYA